MKTMLMAALAVATFGFTGAALADTSAQQHAATAAAHALEARNTSVLPSQRPAYLARNTSVLPSQRPAYLA